VKDLSETVEMSRKRRALAVDIYAPTQIGQTPAVRVSIPPPTTENLPALLTRNARAGELVRMHRDAPSCEGCACFRLVSKSVQVGKYYPRWETETRRMCAHPAYSEVAVDNTRGRLDFIPVWSCEESRDARAICGPEGRLFVSAEDARRKFLRSPKVDWLEIIPILMLFGFLFMLLVLLLRMVF
jgi:hypothetical protein